MITIIIPTYNRRDLLLRAVASVQKQTEQDWEIIVVDDGSTDDTSQALEQLGEKRLRYERLSHNQGVHMARNRGLDLARGEYVTFLDSDDEFLSEALARSRQVMEREPEVVMVSAPFRLPSGELTSFNRNTEGYIAFEDMICERNIRRHKQGFALFRRSAIGDIRWPTKYVQFIFFRRVAKKGKRYFLPEPLGIYHFMSDDQVITKVRRKVNIPVSIARSRAIADFLDEFGADILQYCPEQYGHFAYGAAIGLLLGGERVKARILAKDAVKSQSGNSRYRLLSLLSSIPFSSYILLGSFHLRRLFEHK